MKKVYVVHGWGGDAKIILKENEEHFNETKKIPEILNFLK